MDEHDPAYPFEQMRGELKRRAAHASRSERWSQRPSYDEVPLGFAKNATHFSSDAELWGAHSLMKEFMKQPISAEALELMPLGAGSTEGENWCAVFAFMVATRETSRQSFHSNLKDVAFPLCGFDRIPHYSELAARFNELEDSWEAVPELLKSLVDKAREFIPSLGLYGMFDATGFLSPHPPFHDCRDAAACKAAGGGAGVFSPASAAEAERARAREVEFEPEEEEPPEVLRTRRGLETWTTPTGRKQTIRRIFANGHWASSFDLTAGFRRYGDGTSWWGGLTARYIGWPLGLPLAIESIPADIQEWDAYPSVYDRVRWILGRPILAVTTDRGPATRDFYKFNTLRDTAVVGGRRMRPGMTDELGFRDPAGRFDEDGLPRCKYCGGYGIQDGPKRGLYFTAAGQARIRYRCAVPASPSCKDKIQSLACEHEWTALLPLSRMHPLYWDLRYVHNQGEGRFRYGRDRAGVDGKDLSSRLHRAGIPSMRLRNWVALLLDWFRVCLRYGWIDPRVIRVRHEELQIEQLSSEVNWREGTIVRAGVGAERFQRRRDQRRALNANVPFQPAWEALRA